MRSGTASFIGFSALAIPTVLIFCASQGSSAGLLTFVGLFFVLVFCNRLNSRVD